MARKGTLTVRVIGDTKPFEDKMSKLSGKMKSIGNKLTVGLTAPLALMGGGAVQSAEKLGESVNAVNVVFGKAADTIFKFGKTAAESAGLSQSAVNEAATTMGQVLQGVGFSADEAATQTVTLTQRAADMASVMNTDVGTALDAIQAALRGEMDPIEKFTGGMSAAQVEAKALEMGLASQKSELDENAKATARMAIIMERTEVMAGDFADTSDQTANAQRIAAARAEDLAASFGKQLIPVKMKLLEVGGRVLDWFGKLDESGQQTVIMAAGVAAAIGPVIRVVGSLITVVQALGKALLFIAANPAVLAIAAIALLAAGLVIAYQRSEEFREAVNRAFEAVMDAGKRLAANLVGGLRIIMDYFLAWADNLVSTAAKAFGWIPGIGDKLERARDAVKGFREKANAEMSRIQTELRYSADVTPALREIQRLRDAMRSIPGAATVNFGGTRGGLVMHSGGVVPGTPGTEVPAILEAGETVIPRGARLGGGDTYNVHVNIPMGFVGNEKQLADEIGRVLVRARRAGGPALGGPGAAI